VPAPGVADSGFSAHAFDLAPAVMLRLFGENSDRGATLAATLGDRSGESPLRQLALGGGFGSVTSRGASPERFVAGDEPPLPQAAAAPFQVARGDSSIATPEPAHFGFDVPAASLPAVPASGSAVADFTVGRYQPVPQATTMVAEPGSIAFEPTLSPSPQRASALAFGDAGAPAGAGATAVVTPSVLRLGALKIGTRTEADSISAPQQALQDNAYGAGANFDVRAGDRRLNVDVSSDYERLTRSDSAPAAPAVGNASWRLPDDGEPLIVPNYADVSKVSVGAAVAVPVVRGLTLKLDYGADRLFGGYGLPGLTNLDATGNSYGGKLTFQIPKTSSSLSFSASSLRYQDNIAPVNTFTQTREDVNFTVKF
jgi:hypothetical protein